MKANYLISSFPIIGILTLGLYPFIMGIVVCANADKFTNKNWAITCGVLNILCFWTFFFLTFIMGFFLNEKDKSLY